MLKPKTLLTELVKLTYAGAFATINGQKVNKWSLPFHISLANNLDVIYKRIENRKCAMIVIDGQKGYGKTTLAVQTAEHVQRGKLDYSCQYSMGTKDFLEKSLICQQKGYHVIIFDEVDYKRRGSMTKLNTTLSQFFDESRSLELLVILCTPGFWRIDGSLWEDGSVRMLLHVYARTNTCNKFKGYSSVKAGIMLNYIARFKNRLPLKIMVFQKSNVYSNFQGECYNLSPEREEELKQISDAKKLENAKKTSRTINKLKDEESGD